MDDFIDPFQEVAFKRVRAPQLIALPRIVLSIPGML
jgi:hypothetical protein